MPFRAHRPTHRHRTIRYLPLKAVHLPGPELVGGICDQPRQTQVGRMVERLGGLFAKRPPAAVLVHSDTNTVSAAAQTGNHAGGPVVHVEAGLRPRTGPCRRNSTAVSSASWPTCTAPPTGQVVRDLRAEGVSASTIHLTGNTIIEATNQMAPDDMAAHDRGPPGRRAGRIRPRLTPSSGEHPRPATGSRPSWMSWASSFSPCCYRCNRGPGWSRCGAASLPHWTGFRSSPPITAPSSAWPSRPPDRVRLRRRPG